MAEPLGILFDLDGTLIDSAPDIHAMANAVLAEEGADPISLDETRAFVGNGAVTFVARMREARGINASEQGRLHRAFLARYDTAVSLTQLYPGVREALSALKASGHRLGVCTNKPHRPACAVLDHLNLMQFFEIVLGGDSLETHKPDPAPLMAGFAALGAGRRVFVGDSEIDANAAQRANVPFLLYTEGYRKVPVEMLVTAAVFSDYAQFPALVEAL